MKPFCDINIIELKDEGMQKEAEKIKKHINPNTFILDAAGKELSSEEFAELLKKAEGSMTFVIGGPEGISDEIKKNAKLLSLSKMTFTHEMCRLFFLEQVYRAYMIINKRSYYHK